MKINNNIPSLVARNALSKANAGADSASKKLSTGKRVNSAADDPAGLAIINKIKTQVKGLEMADRNVGDAISLIQTAEGGLAEIQNMLQRMRELAVQGANDTLTDEIDTNDPMQSDRQKIQEEINQLIDEIDKTAGKIQFNTKPLLNAGTTFTFQVGPNQEGTGGAYGMELDVDMVSVDAITLGLKGYSTMTEVTAAKVLVDAEVTTCTSNRATYTTTLSTAQTNAGLARTAYLTALGNATATDKDKADAKAAMVAADKTEAAAQKLYDDNEVKLANATQRQTELGNITAADLPFGNGGNLDYSTRDACSDAIASCDTAIGQVSQFRSMLGAIQNRLEYTSSAIGVSTENATTALGRIEDTDMAKEMTEYSTRNVLVQAGLAVLAQANQRPQQVLQILQ